jgi:aryl carrier-like protein
LTQIWCEVLRLERVSVHDNFFELGGDSILSIQIVSRAKKAGLQLTPKQIFQNQTIAELALVVGTVESLDTEQGSVTGNVPLTPIQSWFFEKHQFGTDHFNQAMMLELQQPIEPATIERAIGDLLLHHDALRLRFHRKDGQWSQFNAAAQESIPFEHVDLSQLPEDEMSAARRAKVEELQSGLDLQH